MIQEIDNPDLHNPDDAWNWPLNRRNTPLVGKGSHCNGMARKIGDLSKS
jgi:hypothetical protein